jgi:hypothetical protein
MKVNFKSPQKRQEVVDAFKSLYTFPLDDAGQPIMTDEEFVEAQLRKYVLDIVKAARHKAREEALALEAQDNDLFE